MLKGLILDMDGVLWHDSQPIGNLADVFSQIQDLGLKFVLATNNATRTIQEYVEKLAGFGGSPRKRPPLPSWGTLSCG